MGTKPEALHSVGWWANPWAKPARAAQDFYNENIVKILKKTQMNG